MSSETVRKYATYFKDCSFIASKEARINRQSGIVLDSEYEVPPEVLMREDSNEPFKAWGQIPGGGRVWQAYKPEDPIIRNDVLVARDPKYPLQRIVGPLKFIEPILLGYYILDIYYPHHPFRHMDLIASNTYSEEKPYDVKVDGYLWTDNLLEKLKIEEMRAKYSKYGKWNQEKPHVGIRNDTPWPTFFMGCYEHASSQEFLEIMIKQTSNLVHDFTHHELVLKGYQHKGPIAERICISNQARFIEFLCASSFFRGSQGMLYGEWPWGSDKSLLGYFKRLTEYIDSYKSGGNGHLEEANKAFGYKIPQVPLDARHPKFTDFEMPRSRYT